MGKIGGQLRRLGNQGDVQISQTVARPAELFRHCPEKHPGVNPLILGIRVREVPADVPQGRRPQKGVHHRVKQNVRVGVAVQAPAPGDFHAPQNQGAARRQPVNVISVSDSHDFSSCNMALARSRSSWVVTLKFRSSPSTSFTFMPSRSTAEQSSVTWALSRSAFSRAPRRRS